MIHLNKDFDKEISASEGLDPVSLLITEAQKILESEVPVASHWRVVRVEVQLKRVDPFQWLKSQQSERKVYWKGRGERESIAGIGCADEITQTEQSIISMEQFNHHFLNSGASKYYGGIRFDLGQKPATEWESFGGYRFFLPRVELVSTEESTSLVCNLVLPRDKRQKWTILQELSEINIPSEDLIGEANLPLTRLDEPTEESWDQIIDGILNKFEQPTSLEKVVIARKVTFQYNEKPDNLTLFKHLSSITPNHFHFYFQFDSESVFMGASPERLYKREGFYVESEAIAGTGLRSEDGENDSYFADALISSEKDQREHAFVRESILRSMDKLCREMQIDSRPSVLNLNMGRHLKSKFWGLLHDDSSDVDILNSLHPTSAVGGYPTTDALDVIQEMEPFDRGWYAGPVGWIGQDSAEFSVAIRSALASTASISLFSGAGIVNGSIPKKEWLEVEQKNSDFIKVLGLDQRSIKY